MKKSNNFIDSLSSLEDVLSNIGDDMKNVYNGVRENWWKARQIIISDKFLNKTPSYFFHGETANLCADDENPCLLFVTEEKTLYLWNSKSKSWKRLTSFGSKIKNLETDNLIVLDDLYDFYKKEITKEESISIDTSRLLLERFYSFKLLLKLTGGSIHFSNSIIWDGDKTPSFSKGKTYLIELSVINDTILGKVCFTSSNL